MTTDIQPRLTVAPISREFNNYGIQFVDSRDIVIFNRYGIRANSPDKAVELALFELADVDHIVQHKIVKAYVKPDGLKFTFKIDLEHE